MVVKPNGDGEFRELAGAKVHETKEPFTVTGLAGGMKSGKPSVAFVIPLEDGSFVFAETSLALFVTAARVLVAHHGDPTQD